MSDSVLADFCAITGLNQERAKFFIDAAGGNLELAIESFYESGGQGADNFETFEEPIDIDEETIREPQRTQPTMSDKSKAPKQDKKMFSLKDFERDEGSDSEEEGQAFYAGGSETSGQQILGPSKKKNPHKIVTDLFKNAKEHGAQEVDANEQRAGASGGSHIGESGYRLGDGTTPSEYIRGPERPKQPKSKVLKLWKNGFTVDSGELRDYQDPKNKEFLQSIQSGVTPRELFKDTEGAEVHLDMEDHRDEDFEAPKAPYKLFNSEGYMLGSPTPKVVSSATPNEKVSHEETAKKNLNLDESKPTTQVQIRLSDGSRIVIKTNQTHRVSDLRQYILTARPEYKTANFALMTSFPNKEISNESESIKDASLLNSVLMQKLK